MERGGGGAVLAEDRVASPAPARAQAQVTVASYNIHRCRGFDGRNDPERVARVIEEIEPDLIGLQEVESHFGNGPDIHQLNYLAEETGYQAVAGSTILRADSHYGNALLTRHLVLEVRTYDVSVGNHEPRGILDVDLEVHGQRLRVLVTHLGLFSRERRRQTRILLDAVLAHPDEPVVILSDFNEWLPWRRPLRWMHARLGKQPALNTFPSVWPVIALDRIWVAPTVNLLNIQVHDSPLARAASDHLPLRAVVNLNL
ncbi:MAG: endonuclease/exonuclease/phosphatase family protein [Gammaproteobacteria bacterium]|nr:endonuclease/exonuclease/phosphatase family protein [Gammaproteobacteria bacterium]